MGGRTNFPKYTSCRGTANTPKIIAEAQQDHLRHPRSALANELKISKNLSVRKPGVVLRTKFLRLSSLGYFEAVSKEIKKHSPPSPFKQEYTDHKFKLEALYSCYKANQP